MKTVIIKNDKSFFVGVDDRQIDAVATKSAVAKALAETTEYKAHQEKYYEIKEIQSQITCAETKAQKASLKAKWKEEVEIYNKISTDVGSKSNQLFEELTVYFEPGKNEIVPELQQQVDTLIAMKEKLNEKEFILLDGVVGTVVKDQRGTYYKETGKKWKKSVVSEIGEDPTKGYKLYENLSDTERTAMLRYKEEVRISELSATSKQREFNMCIDGALNNAAAMKSRLDIVGDAKSLSKSQESFMKTVEGIEDRYELKYEPLT